MIKQSTVLFIVLSISACNNSHYLENLSDFEKMFNGLTACSFENVAMDRRTKTPKHAYFLDRDLMPDSISIDGYAYFDIDESYHGLKVYKIAIPAKTFPGHVIYFQEPVAKVRKRLKDLYRGFHSSSEQTRIEGLILIADPKDNKRSILSC